MKTSKLFILMILPWLVLSCDNGEEDATVPPQDKCNTVPVQGLSMCFSFTGSANEGLNDDQAQVNGAALTTDRTGNEASAFLFDGRDDFIRVPNPTYQLEGSFTVSAWMFIDEDTPIAGNVRLLDTRNSSFDPNNSLNVYLDLPNEQLEVAGQGLSIFEFDYDVGTWFQVILVYDESEEFEKLEAYVNGIQLEMLTDGFTGHTYANEDLVIGARADIVEVFNGKLDDILIFDRALEESELVELLVL